jgi:DNA-binding response OmpR family regulator/two-component sensor histidine kinase
MEELLQGLPKSDWRYTKLLAMKRNTQRLYNLVNQLLTFRQMETEHLQLLTREGDLVGFLREICASFEEYANSQHMNFLLDAPDGPIQVWFDADKIEKVVVNLLSNAFKFTPSGGTIQVRVAKEGQQVRIRVADNGRGIEEKHLSHIFQRFYEGDQLNRPRLLKSSGIGLSISRELIELHQGSISVSSQAEIGASFDILLPLGNSHLNPDQMIQSQDDWLANYEVQAAWPKEEFTGPLPSLPTPEQATGTENSGKLLLVEDHAELRSYLREIFSPYYEIAEASNGAEGLEKARTWLPDLVLSDIMMEGMNGLELCRQLKADLHISHIPVILLTARSGTAHITEGLEQGADDYLSKPFHVEELKLRIRNLIQSRQQLRQHFVRVISLEPQEITVTPTDEDFLSRSLNIVEEEISNPDFQVEDFAFQLGVSRSLLFTKLQALTDQTPNKFIQSIRLKRAAQLIASGQMNVSEVAYQVGFRDPKYFSKCFQKMFGETPSSRLKKAKKAS